MFGITPPNGFCLEVCDKTDEVTSRRIVFQSNAVIFVAVVVVLLLRRRLRRSKSSAETASNYT